MEQWPRFRGFVVPMLVGMVACSSSTRGKLWSAEGVDVLLLLLREQVCVEYVEGRSVGHGVGHCNVQIERSDTSR
jgi:hypothetical protein